MTERRDHWQAVYTSKSPDAVSWYAAHLETSLRLIRAVSEPSARVIDVGAGASTLVDDLLAEGYRALTVLDIAGEALAVARERLGERAAGVTWLEGDVTRVALPVSGFDVWHDRAVFHFLTEPSDRAAYLDQVRSALAPGGHVVIGTFALDGPPRCSGLEVARYDADGLVKTFGRGFRLVDSTSLTHVTPAGGEQAFLFCVLRRDA